MASDDRPRQRLSSSPKVPTLLALALAVLGAAGCATAPRSEIAFPNGTIEGHPTQWIMDTGAAEDWLFDRSALRTGLVPRLLPNVVINDNGPASLTPPARVNVQASSFTVPLPVWNAPPGPFNDADAGIGWPTIRDNLLFFDGAARTVRVAESLPDPATGWTRLKVLPRDQLFLEWPGADGKPLTVFVDTGAPLGVALPPAVWQAWKSSQAQMPRRKKNVFIGAAAVEVDYVWNAAVPLGAMKLEDVPVEENVGFMAKHSEYALGLFALARLELVVDAPHGVAYVRPLPAARTKGSTVLGPWTVDPALRLNVGLLSAHAACMEGWLKQHAGDRAGAQSDFSRAIEIKPDYAIAFAYRGFEKFDQDDFEGASSDLRRALALDPNNAFAHFLRSLLWLRLGDLDRAAADSKRADELDPGHRNDFKELRDAIESARLSRSNK